MNFVDSFIVKVKRADSPFYAFIKRTAKGILRFHLPTPAFILPIFRALHGLHSALGTAFGFVMIALYRYPVFRSLCEEIGKGLMLERIPYVTGSLRIRIGDQVRLSGNIAMSGARIVDNPELIIGNRVFVGHGTVFAIAKQVVVEDDVLLAGECYVSDYSGHPVDPEARLSGQQVTPDSIHPVRICRNAWLGRRVMVMPGVTIGEGAVVGAGTIVTKDVPAGAICVGSPSRIIERHKSQAANS